MAGYVVTAPLPANRRKGRMRHFAPGQELPEYDKKKLEEETGMKASELFEGRTRYFAEMSGGLTGAKVLRESREVAAEGRKKGLRKRAQFTTDDTGRLKKK